MAKPLSGIVFKVMKTTTGERKTFIRLFEGTIRVRDEIAVISQDGRTASTKVKQLQSLQDGNQISVNDIACGDIAIITGGDLKVGDIIGAASDKLRVLQFHKPPILVKVSAKHQKEEQILHNALLNLTMEDPFLKFVQDANTKENTIHLFGKIQQEVLAESIKHQYGIEATFSAPKIICIEKPSSIGTAVEYMGASNNPFFATVGFRIEPGLDGSGLQYRLEVELGSLLLSFQKAIKETVKKVLQEGLYGWTVTDITVTLTHTGYDSVQSTANDFRSLVPLVLMNALQKAETNVYEPVNKFQLILPEFGLSKVLSQLSALEGTFHEPQYQNKNVHLNGTIPVRTSDTLKSELYSLTSGEGMISFKPNDYVKVKADFPKNSRTQLNPLNRGEYLLHLNKIK